MKKFGQKNRVIQGFRVIEGRVIEGFYCTWVIASHTYTAIKYCNTQPLNASLEFRYVIIFKIELRMKLKELFAKIVCPYMGTILIFHLILRPFYHQFIYKLNITLISYLYIS